jgi:hypothetical protein
METLNPFAPLEDVEVRELENIANVAPAREAPRVESHSSRACRRTGAVEPTGEFR